MVYRVDRSVKVFKGCIQMENDQNRCTVNFMTSVILSFGLVEDTLLPKLRKRSRFVYMKIDKNQSTCFGCSTMRTLQTYIKPFLELTTDINFLTRQINVFVLRINVKV